MGRKYAGYAWPGLDIQHEQGHCGPILLGPRARLMDPKGANWRAFVYLLTDHMNEGIMD